MINNFLFLLFLIFLIFTGYRTSADSPYPPAKESAQSIGTSTETDTGEQPSISGDAGTEELSAAPPAIVAANPHIEIKEGYAAVDYASGDLSEYSYEAYYITSEDTELSDYYWQFAVSRNSEFIGVLTIESDEMGMAWPELSGILQEADVNFDGVMDILLCLGHWGNQGALIYKCFLAQDASEAAQDKTVLTECPSFADIANPSPDSSQKLVLSSWRNSAVSHGYGKYKYMNHEFILSECLTEFLASDNGKEVWNWKIEEWKDGAAQVEKIITTEDYTRDEIHEILYGENSEWKLMEEKWSPISPP